MRPFNFEDGYNQGVTDCKGILADIFEDHKDSEVVQQMYDEWLDQVERL